MRVLITGGGTAGHVNPALAIADAILARSKDAVIEYVGTENGIEGRLVRKRGMKLHPIEVYGLKRSLSPYNVKALAKALEAKKKCKAIIREFRPDVVIGTGGYVCWPLISAASSMKVPTVLHEANVEPGFAIKTLQHKTDLILVNFEDTKKWLKRAKNRVLRVGMPVNQAFYSQRKKRSLKEIQGAHDDGVTRILSFGGSLGARQLNLSILSLMKAYIKDHPDIVIEHSCGAREFDYIRGLFEESGLSDCENIKLSDYIYDMPEKMLRADLVICRSGASTLAELAAAGKASVLIPSPNVTGDQQRKNARALSERGAAVVIEDREAIEMLTPTVAALLEEKNQEKLSVMRKEVEYFAVEDCDEQIFQAIKELIQ